MAASNNCDRLTGICKCLEGVRGMFCRGCKVRERERERGRERERERAREREGERERAIGR